MELNKECRIIHFIPPGIDGQFDIRGDYQGKMEDSGVLIEKLLNKLNIKRVFLFGFCAGAPIMHAVNKYMPDRVKGLFIVNPLQFFNEFNRMTAAPFHIEKLYDLDYSPKRTEEDFR